MVPFFIELDDGKIYRKALYLMVKTHGFPVDFPEKTNPLNFLSPGGCGNGHHRYSRDPKRQRLDPHGRQLLHHRVGSGGRSTYLWKCAEVCHCISEIMP